jgi:signal transduction histidine kinase
VGQDQDEAVVAVRDHGIGIPRSEQAKVFERFHRVPTGLVHDVKGSGLGLAIVRHIVEAHGGRLQLVSAPGEGSTFTLRLPLRRAADAATARIAGLPQDARGS